MQVAPKNGHRTAQRATRMLRGEVIDHFAQVEHAVSKIIVRAVTLPAYQAQKLELPRTTIQKREHLVKLMSGTGPLRPHAVEIVPLLGQLAEFDAFRNLMAHGIVQPNGEPSYVFRMICSSSDGPSGFTFALTPSEAQKLSTKLAKIAVPLASKLEAIAESMDKLSKDRAKKNGR